MTKEYVRDFYGHILGSIETASDGKKTARNFYGKILGRYNPRENYTRDFYGKIISKGDTLSALIFRDNNSVRT